jgi:hypothetical protein
MEIKRTTPFVARQNLSDLLDNSFKMMGQTWKTSLPLALALFVPLCALLGWVAARFLGGMVGLLEGGEEAALALVFGYFRLVLAVSGVSLLFWLSSLFVYAAVSTHVAAAAGGRTLDFWEIVGLAGRRFFARSLLAQLVQSALLSGLMTFVLLLAVPAVALAVAGKAFIAAAVGGAVGLVLLGAAATVWLSVSLSFARQAVVFEGEGVFGSLQASARLVRGSWWRLFGITLLVSIILSFAAGLLTLPVTGAALLPLMSKLIGRALDNSFEAAGLAEVFRSAGVGLAIGVGGGTFIQAAIEAFFLPVFFGLFYIDLKVRKGELPTKRAPRTAHAFRTPPRSSKSRGGKA